MGLYYFGSVLREGKCVCVCVSHLGKEKGKVKGKKDPRIGFLVKKGRYVFIWVWVGRSVPIRKKREKGGRGNINL